MTKQDTTRGKNEAGARHTRLASFVSAIKKADTTTKALYCSVALAVVVMAVVIVAVANPAQSSVDAPQDETPVVTLRHPLTGEETDVIAPLPQVFAVMVENSADAWPLAGLEDAFLVIEAPVEGMIPRFEVFFEASGGPDKIGPVRSARPYYVDWADELDAVYVHVGGSPEALDLIADYGTIDLNEFFQGEYFYRWSKRYAPHNAYTTMEDLITAMGELTRMGAIDGAPEYEAWSFKDGAASGEAKSLQIDWTTGTTYDVAWNYDAATNAYTRQQGGTSNFLEGAVATANNVVVMESDIEVVDGTGRRHIRTTGTDDALVFQDGRVIVATWKKDTRTDRLRFYDSSGTEIAMNAGKTWIEVVSSVSQATIEDVNANTLPE